MISELTIEIAEIGASGLHVDRSVPSAWLAAALGPRSAFQPSQEGRLRLEFQRAEEVIRVRGTTQLALEAACSRCLEAVPMQLATPIDVALFPSAGEPTAESEVDADDTGVGMHNGERIDLGRLLADEVFLQLPMNPLCNENCLGLCPRCGLNRNDRMCECGDVQTAGSAALSKIQDAVKEDKHGST